MGTIIDQTIKIKPSKSMEDFINKMDKDVLANASAGIKKFVTSDSDETVLLEVVDLHWLQGELRQVQPPCYLHELLKGCEIVLPEPEVLPRSPELEARVQRLRQEQEARAYRSMTKNVDAARVFEPEDSISYQLRQINKQLIAVFQFVLSVAAGFAFGFLGIELMIGDLDFGFRLLLGVMCALIIALAEIYFLAKKLSEDVYVEKPQKPHKD
ncbi:Transmembrane protein [Gryllus bimaculatus]|nr:Transmembrane protein [Gryllus bimaculatus]